MPAVADQTNEPKPRLLAIAGGKGGTGKSLIAANVGIFLATLGKRVVLVDGALGSANLHVFAGMGRPLHTLSELLGDVPMADLVEPTPVPGLSIVTGAHDPAWASNVSPAQSQRLLEGVRTLRADIVVVDVGSGAGSHTLDWFLEADIGVLVTVAEPISVELCYRFMRAAFLRQMQREGLSRAVGRLITKLPPCDGGIASPLDLYEHAREGDPELASAIGTQIARFRPHLVVNCARSKADMELGRAVAAAARRRLGPPVTYLGHLEYDEAVWAAVRRRRPLLVEHPEARVSKCIEKVTRRLLAIRDMERELGGIGAGKSYYDLLEVEPAASFEDIRRANRRIRELYGRESVVISGLYTDAQLEALQRDFDDAYTTLMDAARRKEYDMKLFPEGVPSQEVVEQLTGPAKVEVPPAERPPMPDLGPESEFTGRLLQQIREAMGIDLREIAERTKIGMAYLQAVEGEDFEKLPAAVYVRGFLVEYCKMLALDSDRVIETYLTRYRGGTRRKAETS